MRTERSSCLSFPAEPIRWKSGRLAMRLCSSRWTSYRARLTRRRWSSRTSGSRVSAQRIYTSRRAADFERRLHSGAGHIIDQKEIAKRQVLLLTDLLRTIPGVRIVPSRYSSEDVLMRGGEGVLGPGTCPPDIYIDGARISNDPAFPINSLVLANDLRALEVYARPATVPTELRTLSGCGVIAIWTVGSR